MWDGKSNKRKVKSLELDDVSISFFFLLTQVASYEESN
jgi:hypothetical protein